MKTPSISVLLLLFILGFKANAQEIDPVLQSINFEDCIFSFKEPLTNDDEFFCDCVAYHLGGFTKEDLKKLVPSSHKADTVNFCKKLANEFGKKPVRNEEIEWGLMATFTPANITQQGVYYALEKTGQGPLIKPGQTVSLLFEISLFGSDKAISSTLESGEPLTFEVGKGSMIKGLELGVQQFNKGAEGYLVLPSQLAYGSFDRGEALPANSEIFIYIIVLDVK